MFAKGPEKYAPQYGGYCAWALAQGQLASVDPHSWAVVGGKLYLNCNPKVQVLWAKDLEIFIKRADLVWAKLENDRGKEERS